MLGWYGGSIPARVGELFGPTMAVALGQGGPAFWSFPKQGRWVPPTGVGGHRFGLRRAKALRGPEPECLDVEAARLRRPQKNNQALDEPTMGAYLDGLTASAT